MNTYSFRKDLLAVQEELDARRAIDAQGCRVEELSEAEHDAFARAVAPMMAEASEVYGRELLEQVGR